MEAIIYTSNSGSTAKYAEMLSHELHLPTYNLKGAKQKVPAGAEVIYLGWIMAGKIKGYSKASEKYNIKAENLNEIIRWYNRQK